jgi:outer membrane protein OmpA-like peptidoglycan-associated protein
MRRILVLPDRDSAFWPRGAWGLGAAFAFALGVAGCSLHAVEATGRAPLTAQSEAEIIEGLPSYQSPGPNTSGETLLDEHGEAAALPSGVAFATSVVAFEPGNPAPTRDAADPQAALGPPDYAVDVHLPPRAVSIGNGGSLVLRFEGAGLGDAPGPDLFIFEIGAPEAMEVALSEDGVTFRELGRVHGGLSAVDIAPWVKEGESFHFVRIRDVASEGPASPAFAGADIDAVGVRAGEVRRVALPSQVLFDFDDDRLGSAAPAALDPVAAAIAQRPGARVSVEGHTDEIGTSTYNQRLSERRAEAVAAYLVSKGVARDKLSVQGFGASRPLSAGDDDESRRKNRRVEIVIRGM